MFNLKLVEMIEVVVFKTVSDWENNQSCMCRRVEYNDSISFPFDEIRKAIKVFFGKDCVIVITLM